MLYRLVKHRRNFTKLLATSDSALTTSRFVRLGLLSGTYILFTVPMSAYQLVTQIQAGGTYIPYDWHEIHRGVSLRCAAHALVRDLRTLTDTHDVSQYSKGVVFYAVFLERVGFENYLPVISAFLVFVFFGLSTHSIKFVLSLLEPLRRKKDTTHMGTGTSLATRISLEERPTQ